MKKERVIILLIVSIFVCSLSIGYATEAEFINHEDNICILEGTWVLYEGGKPAYDVIIFNSGGYGECYELSDVV